MHQRNIGLAFRCQHQRLAGSNGNGLHPIAGLLLEKRNQYVEQARVLRAGGGCKNDIPVLGISGLNEMAGHKEQARGDEYSAENVFSHSRFADPTEIKIATGFRCCKVDLLITNTEEEKYRRLPWVSVLPE